MTRWQTDEYRPQDTADDLPLFQPQVRQLSRRGDPETSKQAALRIADKLTALQGEVLAAFRFRGPMTAKQAERLSEFMGCGFSTIRKRCSEGLRDGWLRDTGKTSDGCKILEAVR